MFLQENRTNYVCVCVCVCVKEIYYKALSHMIMEAGKSQDLQDESASWRPRRADDEAPIRGQWA